MFCMCRYIREHFFATTMRFFSSAVKLGLVHQKLYSQAMVTVSGGDTGTQALSAVAEVDLELTLYSRVWKGGNLWHLARLSFVETFFPCSKTKESSVLRKPPECSLKGILLRSYFVNADKWGLIMFQGRRLHGLLTSLLQLGEND